MKQQPIFMRKHGGALRPVSAYDAERLDMLSTQQDIEVTVRQKRSSPQHRLYWVTLGNIVEATGKWPTADHLHDLLKLELGVSRIAVTFSGDVITMPDSTAFNRMDQAEFQQYFDRAMALLAEQTGCDPLAIEEMAA